MLKAIIFDVDGTLAETEELHRRAFNDTFAAAGLLWNWNQADYARLLATTGGKERIARFMFETGATLTGVTVADLHAAKTARYVALIAQGEIALRPGIADLIAQAQSAGTRLAIATTTSLPNVQALALAAFKTTADRIFEFIAAGDIVSAKKPSPDVYQLVLDRMQLGADQVVALEDSRNGLAAAQAAGIFCVVCPSIYTANDDLTGADLKLTQFAGLGGLAGLTAIFNQHKGRS